MFAMMDAIRAMRSSGTQIDLLALDFDPEADADLAETANQRDSAMARRALAARDRVDRVIVLVGNVHARATRFEHGDYHAETIGSVLPRETFVSANTLLDGGSSWGCRGASREEVECGVRERNGGTFSGPPRVLADGEYGDSPQLTYYGDAYDSYIFLGSATASLPAVPVENERED